MENILNWFRSFSVSDAITSVIALIGAVVSIIKSISAKKSAVKAEEPSPKYELFLCGGQRVYRFTFIPT